MTRQSNLLVIFTALFSIISCKKEDPAALIPLSDLLPNGYTIEVNPHEICPLCAEISFTSVEPVNFEYTVTGSIPFEKSTELASEALNAFPIIGLYENSLNAIVLRFTRGDGDYALDTIYIETDSSYTGNPEIKVTASAQLLRQDGLYLADAHFAEYNQTYSSRPFAFDHNGDIRWQLNIADAYNYITWASKLSSSGTVFCSNNGTILEFSLTGELLSTYDQAGQEGYKFHHDVIELPNGNFVGLVDKTGTSITSRSGQTLTTMEDFIIEIDRNTGAIITEWDLREILDVNRQIHAGAENGDWFHANSVEYSPHDNCLIISGRHQGVIKVDWQNNLKWILSPNYDWGSVSGETFEEYLLTAVNADGQAYSDSIQKGFYADPGFDWPWVQHSALLAKNGDLILFDNGWNRHYIGNGTANQLYSRYVKYHIDETNKTVSQAYTFGSDLGYGHYSMIVSNVQELDNGNLIFAPCYTFTNERGKIVEFNPSTNQVLFSASLLMKDLTANPNANPGWGQIDLIYRITSVQL